jgi:hypothetical protein
LVAVVEIQVAKRLSLGVAWQPVQDVDPAEVEALNELRRLATDAYGEERLAEAMLQNALRAAANAVWRVSQEPLEPDGDEP